MQLQGLCDGVYDRVRREDNRHTNPGTHGETARPREWAPSIRVPGPKENKAHGAVLMFTWLAILLLFELGQWVFLLVSRFRGQVFSRTTIIPEVLAIVAIASSGAQVSQMAVMALGAGIYFCICYVLFERLNRRSERIDTSAEEEHPPAI